MLQSRVQSSPCLQRGNSSRALGCWTPGSRTARNVVVRMNKVLHGEHGHGDHTVKWFEKHKEMWHELDSKAGFDKALQELPAGKMLLIDYYAPSCAVCKTAFPALCKVADDKQYQADYVFCKASLTSAEVKAWVKAEGVTGIPHIGVYSPEGKKLLGMGASVKKMEAVKSNLSSIAQHKEAVIAEGHQLQLDPEFLVVLPESAVVSAQ